MSNKKFIPSTISDEAARFLKARKPRPLNETSPEGWEKLWKAREDERIPFVEAALKAYPAQIKELSIAEHNHLLITPDNHCKTRSEKLLVYVHGGAHVLFSPRSTLVSSLPAAFHSKTQVLAIDYPLAWQNPFPAARDLLTKIYVELLKDYEPHNIAMYGDSAGGGMLVSSIHELMRAGFTPPAALGLISPWVDSTKTGDSLTLVAGQDPILDYEIVLENPARVYANGHALDSPGISPINAQFTGNFPPTYISTGTRDLFLSHCARFQRKLLDANVRTELVVYEGMWHVFQALRIPEECNAWKDMVRFLGYHWN